MDWQKEDLMKFLNELNTLNVNKKYQKQAFHFEIPKYSSEKLFLVIQLVSQKSKAYHICKYSHPLRNIHAKAIP